MIKKPTKYEEMALREYANAVGDDWKTNLMYDWMRAGTKIQGVDYTTLHQLRNRMGPSWLETYELPQE